MLDLAISQIYTLVFHLWKSVALDNAWDGESRPFFCFSLVYFRAFRDSPQSQFLCRHFKLCWLDFLKMLDLALSNLHTCISLVEVYRFGQCLGWRFSPISTFFSLVSARAFRDAPHSRFRCQTEPNCETLNKPSKILINKMRNWRLLEKGYNKSNLATLISSRSQIHAYI